MATFKPTSSASAKKTFTPTKYAGYSTSTLRGWQAQNKSALDILNEYQKKIQNNEWLSSEDRAKYKAAIDEYTSSGNALRKASQFYGTKYTPEEEKSWQDSLSSLAGGIPLSMISIISLPMRRPMATGENTFLLLMT